MVADHRVLIHRDDRQPCAAQQFTGAHLAVTSKPSISGISTSMNALSNASHSAYHRLGLAREGASDAIG
jgi:hypothetical protein